MLNAGYKKEALAGLEVENKRYQNKYNSTMKEIMELHESRIQAVELVKRVEEYVSSIANKPKEFEKLIDVIKLNYKRFESEIRNLELESKNINKVSGTVVGAGVVAGAGVAAFGPAAAMAVATTFGTASTGTAIATLSGAAATNAALAWLGGGALVTGGGGMSAGSAFLAMAGPVGWAIGGAAVVGGGVLANSKNKKIARQAEESIREIKIEIEKISAISIKVNNIRTQIGDFEKVLVPLLNNMINDLNRDYKRFTGNQLDNMKKLLNTTVSLSTKLNEKVN